MTNDLLFLFASSFEQTGGGILDTAGGVVCFVKCIFVRPGIKPPAQEFRFLFFHVEECQGVAVRRIFPTVRRILVRNQKLYDRIMGKWQKAGKGDYQIAERRDDRIRTDEENVTKFLTMGGFYT